MSKQITLSIDEITKEKAELAAKRLHISLSVIARILLSEFAEGKISIGAVIKNNNEKDENGFTYQEKKILLKAFKEAKKGLKLSKTFHTAKDLISDLKR